MVASSRSEVLGHYTIHEQLGRGGMATVNRAEMHGLAGFKKQVALKRLHPDVAEDPAMVQSLVHEARLASHLHHPNIAQTYDLGNVDGTYFIAMEYIPGSTLSQLLRRCAAVRRPVPVPIALSILTQLCDALDYAHNLCDEHGKPLGIIHRDVSPSNIIISSTGVVKLIDFGIAKAVGRDRTDPGLIKGKPSYMAPECLWGPLDLRADLFGLGVIAHELLTGRALFHARNDFDTMTRLREMPVQPPSRWNPDVPLDLDDIVLTALQRKLELRWQNAAAMRTALTNVMMALGTPVTNHHVLEWVEAVLRPAPPTRGRALARVLGGLGGLDGLAEPPCVAAGSGIDLARELASLPAHLDEPQAPCIGPQEQTRPMTRPMSKAAVRPLEPPPRAAPRLWRPLLLLLLSALLLTGAALAREQLVDVGRDLHAWYAS